MINGDDILFQSSERFARHWMSVVAEIGLEVEETKTSISDVFGTLNSTLFEWNEDKLRVVPTIRMGMLRETDYVVSLGAGFRSFAVGNPKVKWNAAKVFFRWHLVSLRSVRLSLDEIGFRGTLAIRMSRIFGLFPKDASIFTAPKLPCPHNCHLPSGGDIVEVERGSLGEELETLSALQMVSWRWGVEFKEENKVIQYCLALSRVRWPQLSFYDNWSLLTPPSVRTLRGRFKRPLTGRCMVPVFRDVLLSQDHDWEPLPRYEEVEVCTLLCLDEPEKG